MKTIGILFGMENTFPGALADRINAMGVEGVHAEPVKIGGIRDDHPAPYDVIVDRISHRMPYYRSWLKHAALNGSIVINDPFLCSADDKFVDVTIARRAGAAVPRTVLIPSKEHPPETTAMSMRNLLYPLNWDELFSYVGFPLFMKPHHGGGWRQVYKIHTPEEFFFYYDQSGPVCMMIQEAIHHEAYYRCFCIGRRDVRIMPFAPHQPLHLRYIAEYPDVPPSVLDRMRKDVLAINDILGYDFNAVEFAVRGGIPYAIDCMNPAPDCERNSITPAHFDWVVEAVARLAVDYATGERTPTRPLMLTAAAPAGGPYPGEADPPAG